MLSKCRDIDHHLILQKKKALEKRFQKSKADHSLSLLCATIYTHLVIFAKYYNILLYSTIIIIKFSPFNSRVKCENFVYQVLNQDRPITVRFARVVGRYSKKVKQWKLKCYFANLVLKP